MADRVAATTDFDGAVFGGDGTGRMCWRRRIHARFRTAGRGKALVAGELRGLGGCGGAGETLKSKKYRVIWVYERAGRPFYGRARRIERKIILAGFGRHDFSLDEIGDMKSGNNTSQSFCLVRRTRTIDRLGRDEQSIAVDVRVISRDAYGIPGGRRFARG